MPRLVCRQIDQADIPAVVSLLSRSFRGHTHCFWQNVFAVLARRTPPPELPQYGYLLADRDAVIGTLLLIGAAVPSDGAIVHRCNLSSWCIAPAFAVYAPLLVSRALRNASATYINISPARHTRRIIEAEGFAPYNRGVFVSLPTLNRPKGGYVRILSQSETAETCFNAAEQRILLEHAAFGCTSLWCATSESAVPFVFRFRKMSGLPCAQLIYCRDVADFVRFAAPIGRHLAQRGRFCVLVDANGPIAGLVGMFRPGAMPKYFKGPVPPRLGDLAYTEAALFGI